MQYCEQKVGLQSKTTRTNYVSFNSFLCWDPVANIALPTSKVSNMNVGQRSQLF